MLRLVPMSHSEFQAYLETAIADYADSHRKAEDCLPEDALELAQKEYSELLPQGLSSSNQFLFSAVAEINDVTEVVGMLWFGVKETPTRKAAFIYDFKVADECHRRGYGSKMMSAYEARAREMGVSKSNLVVFGFNVAARNLYEKVGYQITRIRMVKKL